MDEFVVRIIIFQPIIHCIIVFNSVNIGQTNPTTPTSQSASSQARETSATLQTSSSTTGNIPGVAAGSLDFSNIARSIGNMVQGIAGRFIPGATSMNTNPTTATATVSSLSTETTSDTNLSSQGTNSTTGTVTNNNNTNENDAITTQMLTGMSVFVNNIIYNFLFFPSVELLRLLGGGLDNPELENLTIGSFMQRFGEDIDSRPNDGKEFRSNT